MALAGAAPQSPLPIDELEGELWLEVDRYTEARDAYDRAVKARPTPNALIGLARASDKLGDVVGACAAYTRVRGMPGLPSAAELEIALYALKCKYCSRRSSRPSPSTACGHSPTRLRRCCASRSAISIA